MAPPQLLFDPARDVAVEIRAATPSVFQFRAQSRVPGGDYVDFGRGEDDAGVEESVYRLTLPATHASPTDLRFYVLVYGKKKRPFDIAIALSQDGGALGAPLPCAGTIPDDGSVVLQTVEAVLV